MDTVSKVVVMIMLSITVVFLIVLATSYMVAKIKDRQKEKQKKLEKDKEKDKGKDKIEELEKRIRYLEFCKREPTGVELKIVREASRGVYLMPYRIFKRLAIFEYGATIHEVCYKKNEVFCNEELKEFMGNARKDKIYKNTPETLIIFNEEEGYTKIEKCSGKVMDVTDIINLKGKEIEDGKVL